MSSNVLLREEGTLCKFVAKGSALTTAPAELLIRLVMCALPVATFAGNGVATSAVMALFFGIVDGYARLWGSYTSRSFVADSDGLEISSGFGTRVVPWANVAAIGTWHHFNRIEYVAIHYLAANRVEVATCLARYAGDDLRAFVQVCAVSVSQSSPRPSITMAGLGDRAVYRPLLRRLAQDVACATLVGLLIGLVGPGFFLGLLAASASTMVAAVRHSLRDTKLVLSDGSWCPEGSERRPLRTIPPALRLWMRCLAKSAPAPDEMG